MLHGGGRSDALGFFVRIRGISFYELNDAGLAFKRHSWVDFVRQNHLREGHSRKQHEAASTAGAREGRKDIGVK